MDFSGTQFHKPLNVLRLVLFNQYGIKVLKDARPWNDPPVPTVHEELGLEELPSQPRAVSEFVSSQWLEGDEKKGRKCEVSPASSRTMGLVSTYPVKSIKSEKQSVVVAIAVVGALRSGRTRD